MIQRFRRLTKKQQALAIVVVVLAGCGALWGASRLGRRTLRPEAAWRFWLATYLSLSQMRIGLAMKIDE